MRKISDIIGIGLVLLVITSLGSDVSSDNGLSSTPSGSGSRLPLAGPDLGSLAGEFHRMVGLMERVDSVGQMAVNPPRLPEPSQLINTSALPDISALMDLAGPLLNNFKGEK